MTTYLSKPRKVTENTVEKQVVEWLQSKGWRATRNHVGTFRALHSEQKVSIGKEGFPDWTFTRKIGFTGSGRVEYFHFEAKKPGEKPSPKQFEVMASLNQIGELSVWADSFERFKVVYLQNFGGD